MIVTRSCSRKALLACASGLALTFASPAFAQEVNDDQTTPIDMEEGTAVNVNNGGNLSVTCDVPDDANDPADENYTEAVKMDVPNGAVTIDDGGNAEMTRDADCASSPEELATIRATDSGDPEAPTSGTIDVNGTLSGPEGGYAIYVDDTAGGQTTDLNDEEDPDDDELVEHQVDVTVGETGVVDGDVYLGANGNHSFTNEGEVNGTVTLLGRDTAAYTNIGTHNGAGVDNNALVVDDNLNEGQRETTLDNSGDIVGNVVLKGGNSHTFQSTGTVTGNLTVSQGASSGFTDATISNFGTFTGDIIVEDGVGGLETVDDNGTPETDDDTTVDHFVEVSNGSSGTLVGDVQFGYVGNHTFSNSGVMEGRVDGGTGNNTVTLSGGRITATDETDFSDNGPLIALRGGDDTVNITGGTIAPITAYDELESPLSGSSLINTGGGNDTVTMTAGVVTGANVAINLSAGDDRFEIAPATVDGEFILEGRILGGDDVDTFATSGIDADNPFIIGGLIDLDDFESYEAMANHSIFNIEDDGEFDVWGGSFNILSGAEVTIIKGLDATVDQIAFTDLIGLNGTSTQLVESLTADIAGTLNLEQPTYLTGDTGTFTVSDGGTMLFRVQRIYNEDAMEEEVVNGALLIDDVIAPDNNFPLVSDGTARLELEAGSSLGLTMDSKDVMGRDGSGNAIEAGSFTVAVATDVTAPLEGGGNINVDDAGDLSEIGLIDDNPYYRFEFDVTSPTAGFTAINIIALRNPGFAQTILDNASTDLLGSIGSALDNEFEDCLANGDVSNIGTVVTDTGGFCGELRALGLRPDSEIVDGLALAAPNRMAGAHQSILNIQNRSNDLISNRTNRVRAGTGRSRTIRHARGRNVGMNAGGSVFSAFHAWAEGFGGIVDQDKIGNNSGFDAKLYGGLFGLDRRLSRQWLVGLYGGYSKTKVDGKDISNDQLDVVSYLGGLYGSWFNSTSSAEVMLTGGYDKYDGDRFGFLGGAASRDYNGYHAGFRAAADTNVVIFDKLLLTPSVSLQYTYLQEDAYDETGDPLAILSVDERTSNSFQSRLGARLQAPGRVGNNFLLPFISLGWMHEFVATASESVARFAAGTTGSTFTAPELDIPSDALNAGLGVDFSTLYGTTVSFGYDFTYQESSTAHVGAATVRVKF